MLTRLDPAEAYRRTAFDARVYGAGPGELVAICFEQLVHGLSMALLSAQRSDNAGRSKALTRALGAVTALEMGVDREQPLGRSLLRLYEAARCAILDSVIAFDAARLATIRDDFRDVAAAMTRSEG